MTLTTNASANSRPKDTMKFRLGLELISAINDGGLNLRYNAGRGVVQWQPGGTRSILSLEVIRPLIIAQLIQGQTETIR